jgi:hypothetical protein
MRLNWGGALTLTNQYLEWGDQPCDGSTVSGGNGSIQVVVNVVGGQIGNPLVLLYVILSAQNLSGTDGDTYSLRGQATATYNTLVMAPSVSFGGGCYQLPLNEDFDNLNDRSKSFLAATNAQVCVDAVTQKPESISIPGYNAVCDGK